MVAITKIFVCSTSYDLIDIRAEVYKFIDRLGFEALAFEDLTFLTYPGKSRHDMCLEKVDKADALIAIIDRRAGSLYDGDRFPGEDITVTLAEARSALERGIPVVVFVRDQTWTERNLYNGNKKKVCLPLRPNMLKQRMRKKSSVFSIIFKKTIMEYVTYLKTQLNCGNILVNGWKRFQVASHIR